jgi:AcrR family transcriptional regulator
MMRVVKKTKTLSPKKLEIQQRPGRILNIARRILKEEGYAFITIDRIAKELDCSRSPIYEFFASREDVVMGLAIEDIVQRWKLLKSAISFKGYYREKITAMSAIFDKLYPEHLKILVIL